ncbi:hypothetical protein BDA99DRAFT_491777 [Phascolomyces articulosus]|uniref:DUF788-domain-containing protein n=1 Tax=Phascolomyces articulosus TaxID=60185 RepID=A0AAD5KC88_9FUNG|nr:hypothetical protein BDA99DRAFT_491777 [Phascolomyces articulosus]
MANASAKKLAIANDRILDNLRKGFMIVHLLFIGYRIIYNWDTFTTGTLVLYMLTTGVSMFMYSTLETTGRPYYDATGTLIKSGEDMNAEGLTAYMFDIIYVTWFTQVMVALVSYKFWYTFLVIPGYAAYKVFPMLMTYLRQYKEAGITPQEEGSKSKRQAKMEKREKKGHVKYVR